MLCLTLRIFSYSKPTTCGRKRKDVSCSSIFGVIIMHVVHYNYTLHVVICTYYSIIVLSDSFIEQILVILSEEFIYTTEL